MRKNQNTNSVDVSHYVNRVRGHLEKANREWRGIGDAFSEAFEEYGPGSDSFLKLLKETEFSHSTASKLISIATSERLKTYQKQLVLVESRGTLYAIHAMKDDAFDLLRQEFKFDSADARARHIKMSDVKRVRDGKKITNENKVFAFIMINERALELGDVDGTAMTEIEELLEKFPSISSYITVRRSGIDERIESRFQAKVEATYKESLRKAFGEVLATAKKSVKRRKGMKADVAFTNRWGISKEEVNLMFEADPKEAFSYFGAEPFDQERLYNEAIARVQRNEESRWTKLRSAMNSAAAANGFATAV